MNEEEALTVIKNRYPNQPAIWSYYLKARRFINGTKTLTLNQATKVRLEKGDD